MSVVALLCRHEYVVIVQKLSMFCATFDHNAALNLLLLMIIIRNKILQKEMLMIISDYFAVNPVQLMDVDSRDARCILAARCWFVLKNARQDPLPRMRGYLASTTVATRFALIMDTVQQIWPYPFAIHRPCCGTASLDEALLTCAISHAVLQDRPAFDSLLHEMLGNESRQLLYARSGRLYDDDGYGNIR
jgi:hypothetical protein